MYALVDCNSFFASCEQIFRPDLRDKPVVVLSNNDGCIVARSKEAKALNVPDLYAYFKVKAYLDYHNINVFSSNYELYSDISSRVINTLTPFTPEMEVYSIDECFLLLDGLQVDYRAYGHDMKSSVWRNVRMPVCVGIAETKTLSKLANHIAKKSHKLNGVCVIDTPNQWNKVFKKLPVSKVWGVGSRLSKRLGYLNIVSIYDLKTADAKFIRSHFGINLERTITELNGVRSLTFDTQLPPKKQIYSTRSFGEKVYTLEGLQQSASQYATTACEKLRKQNSLVKTVQAFIETSRYSHAPLHRSGTGQLPFPTNDTRTVITAVRQIVASLFVPHLPYAKAGVGLIDIISADQQQLNFFNQYQSEKSESLMKIVDELNHKGLGKISFASSGIDPFWKIQRRLKSPAYTTQLSDIVNVTV